MPGTSCLVRAQAGQTALGRAVSRPQRRRTATWSLTGSLWHFPDDVGGGLVVPQSLEPRVTQLSVGRPFAEAHLGDQAGLHPVHTGPRQAAVVERGPFLLQAGQHGMQAVQRSLVEAGADLAGVDKLVTGIVV